MEIEKSRKSLERNEQDNLSQEVRPTIKKSLVLPGWMAETNPETDKYDGERPGTQELEVQLNPRNPKSIIAEAARLLAAVRAKKIEKEIARLQKNEATNGLYERLKKISELKKFDQKAEQAKIATELSLEDAKKILEAHKIMQD